MDATDDDRDVQLQRTSPDILADLQRSLKPFLWKTTAGKTKIRRRVRARETDRLVALLEPFQELPQLLDPHLNQLVPVLADGFLASLSSKLPKQMTTDTQLLVPVPRAICRLLYTFCKIRGEKVIVRFLSTETRHVELLLSAIETREGAWQWEERYITLLWLSQLLLAPFDLSTISSGETLAEQPDITGLGWPPNVPSVTFRVISVAIKFLSSSGKERDAARILLVRLAMRRDMHDIGILHALMQWAMSSLRPSSGRTSYHYIGILSFLAGVLNSSLTTADLNPYLYDIFTIIQSEALVETIQASVVARKTSLKVLRHISVILLRHELDTDQAMEMVETTIGVMLESLADPATPVRLSASKALSLITLKLPVDMAGQVVEEVLASLKRDLPADKSSERPDLSRVNAAEWHGLILTLSQLLYRRSPPASSLSDILPALLTGLDFEQRSTSGASVGTNVRDAACFGIWALARRYSTDELQAIDMDVSGHTVHAGSSIIQALATTLVVSASLDPAGNIRRGSSAALQELIGRHPNTVAEGISVVQVVDYHAVALRSRALGETAVSASHLSPIYKKGIIEALLGWRGVGDADAQTRRSVAATFGTLVKEWEPTEASNPQQIISRISSDLDKLQPRQDDERHALILCLAHIVAEPTPQVVDVTRAVLDQASVNHRCPELIAEAVSRLIVSTSEIPALASFSLDLVDQWLRRTEDEVVVAVSDAGLALLKSFDEDRRQAILSGWIDRLKEFSGTRSGKAKGLIFMLFRSLPIAGTRQPAIIESMKDLWHSGNDIETRAIILERVMHVPWPMKHEFMDMIAEGLDDYTTTARGDVGSLVRIASLHAVGCGEKQSWGDSAKLSLRPLFGKMLRLGTEKLDRVRAVAQLAIRDALHSSDAASFGSYSISSKQYYRFILDLCQGRESKLGASDPSWLLEVLSGYVGAADTGHEELIRSSRAGLTDFCNAGNSDLVCQALFQLLKTNISNDRILVPTMEVLAFLIDVQIALSSSLKSWHSVYITVQKAHYKTGNVRKLEAAVKLYSGLIEVYPSAADKLMSMLLHPFPTIRNQVADSLFIAKGICKGKDWLKAGKHDLQVLKG